MCVRKQYTPSAGIFHREVYFAYVTAQVNKFALHMFNSENLVGAASAAVGPQQLHDSVTIA